MANEKIALMAHLYRRAGFGATRDELERQAERPYEDVVEDFLHPERFPKSRTIYSDAITARSSTSTPSRGTARSGSIA